jgi:phospholipase/lecithinase/hemolysin
MFDLLRRKSALQAAALAASALLLASCGGSDTEENPAPPPVTNVALVIGASISDNGNECIRTPASCPPAPPYSPGILSNGPLWIDTVVARFGASATPSLKGGTNYAYAGARTGPVPGVTGAAASTVPTLLAQFNTLLLANGNRINPNALMVVDASAFGNNIRDALALIAANPAGATTIVTNVVTSGVTDVVAILNLIFNTGGRNVLVVNVPDIGKTPAVQSLGSAALASAATQMSAAYNGALLQQITSLRALPGYSIQVADAFTLGAQISANPAGFGFTNVTAPCFVPPPTGPLLCPSPNTYLFWDPLHPTYAAGQQLASAALKALGR